MKKIFGMVAVAALVLATATSCKSSSESAYKKAYEKAQAAKQAANQTATSANQVAVDAAQTAQNAAQQATVHVPVQNANAQVTVPTNENNDVRRINGTITVLGGGSIQAYSVVVGSFTAETNAQGLLATLKSSGYPNAQIIKTNETINGITGWYRVIATTHATRQDAAASRDGLRGRYTGAWLLAK